MRPVRKLAICAPDQVRWKSLSCADTLLTSSHGHRRLGLLDLLASPLNMARKPNMASQLQPAEWTARADAL